MRAKNEPNLSGKLPKRTFFLLLTVFVLVFVAALLIGRVPVSVSDFFSAIGNGFREGDFTLTAEGTILFNFRLPRVILASFVGAGLSVAGLTFQGAFRNPLATPDTVGTAAGATFGAALGILLKLPLLFMELMAFSFGLLAALLTFLAGRDKKNGLQTVILSGILIGSLFSALLSLVKFSADTDEVLPNITYFLLGSLSGASFTNLLPGIIPIAVGLILLYAIRFRLNLLPYDEDEVRSLGVSMKRLRLISIFASTMITAACVSLCGQVGWIGLLIPHILRLEWGNNTVKLFPVTVIVGAIFLIVIDTLARSVSASEIPVSVFSAVVGAPFFLILMRKRGGWSL